MGTNIYGSYDQLVIELSGFDAVRAGRRVLRLDIDTIRSVTVEARQVADPATQHLGIRRHPAVMITIEDGRSLRCFAVHRPDAVEMAADLVRCGVGREAVSANA